MISKIMIRNVATYDNVGVAVENLGKVNFIYGANGCGKTTISNFLNNTEGEQFSDCKIEWENDVVEKVYVYNKAFREKNFRESEIAGIFTLGQATSDDIDEINQKKLELDNITKNLVAVSKTQKDLNDKIEKEKLEFKNIIWKDVYKTNEDKFKKAFEGALKKDLFVLKLKEIVLSENDNPDRKDIEERAIELLGNPPIKKEIVSEISNRRLKDIENLEIWGKCIVGKSDIPIAQFIEKLGNGDWVNQGRKYIHLGKRCPFCQKETIDDDFRKQLESFFDKEYEKELEGLKDRKEEYIIEKDNLVTILRELENQDFEDDEKLLIHQLGETINNCLETNERNIEKKISEPSKKIAIHSSDKYIGNINCIIKKRNAEISKHNNLVDNYREEREKLISDIWKLIAKENSELINRHNKKINGFKKGIQEATQKQNQYIEKQRTVEMEIREKNKNVTSIE